MTVSVIVPTFNGERWIGDQLAALAEQTYAGVWELIVADNGSTDDTRCVAAQWAHRFPRFQLIDASGVRGQSHARNKGAREASGDVLLFTDQDDVVGTKWIAQLTAGVSRSRIVSGPVRHFVDGQPPPAHEPWEPNSRMTVGPYGCLFGCNMGIERPVFMDLGGFDETSTLGWEDIDFGIRAALAGIAVEWIDEALILHRKPSSLRVTWRKEYAYGRGWTELVRRYPEIWPQGWVRPSLRRAWFVAIRAPYIALPARRRGWLLQAARLSGRLTERLRPPN